MKMINKWLESIVGSLAVTWETFLSYVPNILAALVIMLIGIIVAATIGKIVTKVFDKLCVDQLLKKTGIFQILEKGGIKIYIANFLGELVRWFILIVFFITAFDILNLEQITDFLNKVLLYIPNVVVAVVIMLVGAIVAYFLSNVIKTTVQAAKIGPSRFLSGLTYYSIIIFSAMAALIQLGIAKDLVETLFTGLVAMISIAGGLAFGLGGKDLGKEILEKLKDDFS